MEESISCSVADYTLPPTSELCQTCKLLSVGKSTVQACMAAKSTGTKTDIYSTRPTYMCLSCYWSRHDSCESVLLCTNMKVTVDLQMDWVYTAMTSVEVTAEEY
eukprot:101566-Rhodomonas_salina.2